jgi:hypothetical protein
MLKQLHLFRIEVEELIDDVTVCFVTHPGSQIRLSVATDQRKVAHNFTTDRDTAETCTTTM